MYLYVKAPSLKTVFPLMLEYNLRNADLAGRALKFSSNGFNLFITVADDVSSLGFLTLLLSV